MKEDLYQFNTDYIVECSKELILNTDKKLLSYRLLELYMGKINAREPENNKVYFSKSELKRILGLSELKTTAIREAIKDLFSIFQIKDENDQWMLVSLFDSASCVNFADGEQIISLICSPSAKKYFFNLTSIGYIRYRLGVILRLRSAYSLELYKYLLRKLDTKTRLEWDVKIDEIRELLKYRGISENKYFIKNVVKKSCEEISSETDVRVEYETYRKASVIRFKVKRFSDSKLQIEADKLRQEIIENSNRNTISRVLNILNSNNKEDGITLQDAADIVRTANQYDRNNTELMEAIAIATNRRDVKNIVLYIKGILKKGPNLTPKSYAQSKLTEPDPKFEALEAKLQGKSLEELKISKIKEKERQDKEFEYVCKLISS